MINYFFLEARIAMISVVRLFSLGLAFPED